MGTISVIVDDAGPEKPAGILGGSVLKCTGPVAIDTGHLKKAFAELSGQISEILGGIKAVGDFKLQQVQVSAEISAEGGVSLIGTAKAGARGAVTLTFGA